MPRACQNLNPFSPWIDQKAISPHIVDTFSNSKVMRKKKNAEEKIFLIWDQIASYNFNQCMV